MTADAPKNPQNRAFPKRPAKVCDHRCVPPFWGSARPGFHATQRQLRSSFKIGHATLQIEIDENNACALAPDWTV